jgi:hypothetical protein
MSAKAYGDGGFFFLQPVTTPRQVVSSYGDGGFYFIEPVSSPRQVVSSYGAFHVSQGFGVPGKKGGSAIGGSVMRIADASGKIVEYPCPRPGVTYDAKLNPCGEKPWWLTSSQWNEYRLTGSLPEAKKEDSKCAELVAKYNEAKSQITKKTAYAKLKAAGCAVPRPTEVRTPIEGGPSVTDELEKEAASLETEQASFWETYKWPLIGLGAVALTGGAFLYFRRPAAK